jgi:hypothetical protein
MRDSKFTKGMIALALAGSFLVSVGASNAQAQDNRRRQREERRDNRWDEWKDRKADRIERTQERAELQRIRQLDRQRRLRYQNANGNRMVGYYDRNGQFHPFGYYDRRNQFWRYQ